MNTLKRDLPEGKFSDQVAVISGGAEGIGKAIALRLGTEGATLVIFDVNEAKLEQTLSEFNAMGFKSLGCIVNIANEDEIKIGFERAVREFGHIEIVINSAGVVGPTNVSILDYSVADFDKVYTVNLRGAFLMSQYALRHMVERNYGRVLLIASIAGKEGNPFMAGYSSTKSGVIGLVKGLGKEFASKNITINSLAPSVIKTSMNENTDPQQLAYMTSKIPMGRLGTVDEVAAMVSFIVSKENSFSTAFVYDISGGRATY